MNSRFRQHMRSRFAGGAALIGALFFAAGSAAAKTNVTATVDRNRVAVGERITLTVTVVTSGGTPSVVPPTLPNREDLSVSGPHGPSTSQEFTIAGGKTTRRSTLSYLFYLTPRREGRIVIPAIAVSVDGQRYETKPIRIVVANGRAGGETPPVQIRVTVSKRRAYQGEEIIIEYTLYERSGAAARVTNRQITQEPNFVGFWVEPLLDARKEQVSKRQTVLDGVPYTVMTVLRVAAFPTTSGSLTIPPLGLSAVVATPTGSRNFWGDLIYTQRAISVASPQRSVEVLPLPPNPPAGFSGAVGTFRLRSSVDRTEVMQGDPVTWTVALEGEGNLKAVGDLLIPPLPEFRAYDPQVTTTLSPSRDRYSGKKVYERILIPLRSGRQEIPPASFVFFDPRTAQYRTIASAAHRLTVRPGKQPAGEPATIGLTQTQIKQVGDDIRFIKPDAVALKDQTETIWRERWYWAIHAFSLALVAVALGVRWRRSYLGGNPGRLRAMAAGAEARKSLKKAHAFLKTRDVRSMAGALSGAVREVVAGHAGVGAAGLTFDRIREILAERSVPGEVVEETLRILAACDRARYSPVGMSDEEVRELHDATFALVRALTRYLTP